MSTMLKVRSSGYCPELKKGMTISIDVEKHMFLGENRPSFAKRGYSCEHASWNGCDSNGDGGEDCPLFAKFDCSSLE
ncbi:hypothetical protein [Anaerotruncus rubiinfantis]|uniref:hypothetical protein n=1 Tax=Anaerotruncus rubiinfantis TaxID=1720200 RepID=UPI0018981EB6|nr:hypothetical protein [Anaerotruncus rubiinfantis]